MLVAQNPYATSSSSGGGAILAVILVIYLAVIVLTIAGLWKTFAKAGKPGWAAIIPIYNTYVELKIIGRPGWWLLLFLVPFVNIVIAVIVLWEFAKSFDKGAGFCVGMLFLPFIFYPILGFGSSVYVGPGGRSAVTPA